MASQLEWRGEKEQRGRIEKRVFSKAQWDKSIYLCSVRSTEIDLNEDVKEIDSTFREVIIKSCWADNS